jgi:hypothetical protein
VVEHRRRPHLGEAAWRNGRALVALAAAVALMAWLPASAGATDTNYCDGFWNSTGYCWSPNASYPPVTNWMSYNEGINYSFYGDMWASIATSDNNYTAKATSSEYLAYLCFGNQREDDAGIVTPYAESSIAGHDDNYSRSGCPNQT